MNKHKLPWVEQWLILWVLLSMGAGVLISLYMPGIPNFLNVFHLRNTSLPIAIGLLVMMYPPLA